MILKNSAILLFSTFCLIQASYSQTGASTRFPLLAPMDPPSRPSEVNRTAFPDFDPSWKRWWVLHWDRILDIKGRMAATGRRISEDGTEQRWRPMSHESKVSTMLPTLARCLKDSDPRIRMAAAIALGKSGIMEGVPLLISASGDKSQAVRCAAALGLGLCRKKEALEPLIKLVVSQKTSTQVRAWGGIGLGFSESKDGAATLLKLLETSESNLDFRVSLAAGLSVSKRPEAVGEIVQRVERDREDPGQVIAFLYLALGRIGSNRAEELCLSGLGHDDAYVRAGACLGASYLNSPDAPLVRALTRIATSDPNENLRAFARLTLGSLGVPQSVQVLIHHVNEEILGDMTEISGLAVGLAHRASDAEILAPFLKSRYLSHKSAFALAVGLTGNERAQRTLVERCREENSPELFPTYAIGASLLGGDVKTQMREILARETREDRVLTAAIALAIQGDLSGIDSIYMSLSSERSSSRQRSLALAAAFVGDQEHVEILCDSINRGKFPSDARVLLIIALGNIADPRRFPVFSDLASRHIWTIKSPVLDEILTLY